MPGKIRGASPPSRESQVKALIRRRYAHLAETDAFPPEGAKRAREAGYPEDWLDALPSRISKTYCGCGYLLEEMDLTGSQVVVDLGCGAGLDVCLIAGQMDKGGLLIALDLTPAMLFRVQEARHQMSETIDTTICLLAGDMEELPLKDNVADLVLANASFNLTLNQQTAFSETARILRPGGRLVARELIREEQLSTDLAQDPMAWNSSLGGVLTEEALDQTIRAAGFNQVSIWQTEFPVIYTINNVFVSIHILMGYFSIFKSI